MGAQAWQPRRGQALVLRVPHAKRSRSPCTAPTSNVLKDLTGWLRQESASSTQKSIRRRLRKLQEERSKPHGLKWRNESRTRERLLLILESVPRSRGCRQPNP